VARIDIGLGHESTTQKRGDLVGIDAVGLGFAAVNSPPGEGISRDEGNPLVLAEIVEPGSGEQALDTDHDILAEGFHRQEKRLGISTDVVVHAYLARGIEDTEVHPVHV
jgi:hypothetical protein